MFSGLGVPVLRPGSPVVCNEVQNASFFLSPYSPETLAYWTAFNDHQLELGGDPFVGAKLGSLLQRVGCRDVAGIDPTVQPVNSHHVRRFRKAAGDSQDADLKPAVGLLPQELFGGKLGAVIDSERARLDILVDPDGRLLTHSPASRR